MSDGKAGRRGKVRNVTWAFKSLQRPQVFSECEGTHRGICSRGVLWSDSGFFVAVGFKKNFLIYQNACLSDVLVPRHYNPNNPCQEHAQADQPPLISKCLCGHVCLLNQSHRAQVTDPSTASFHLFMDQRPSPPEGGAGHRRALPWQWGDNKQPQIASFPSPASLTHPSKGDPYFFFFFF